MHKFLFYNKFIIFLYMFRASGILRYQMLYNTILPPDDEHNSAQNMYRNIINLL